MIIAFTGPSVVSRKQELDVVGHMDDITNELDTWRSGCAYGVDTIAAHQAVMTGVLGVELYVPAAPHNHELVTELENIARIIRLPRGKAEPYRQRNEEMVRGADVLVAYLTSHTFYRSGEWMTVNIAKAYGVEVDFNII